eukprot:TRINITY_DN17854_c0_g1_i1.p1 TRINITY_DN17854_c0_g1~~TRINITY_DN17854_c0_g1_i1.p1  ORF type:complete len:167 (+),score=64.28 TRINITY_DN17854_c0_g1_i1:14-514(+)
MAAVSHLKNVKDAKTREGIDTMMQRCGASSGEPVCVKTFMDVLGSCHIQLEPKEVARLERITQEDGMIEREQFLEFAKRSPAVKEFTMRGSKSRVSNLDLDKAELAFKAIDKDNSGSIDPSELSKLGGSMSKRKLAALMNKLDKDGDGKITLKEFRALFKEIEKEK